MENLLRKLIARVGSSSSAAPKPTDIVAEKAEGQTACGVNEAPPFENVLPSIRPQTPPLHEENNTSSVESTATLGNEYNPYNRRYVLTNELKDLPRDNDNDDEHVETHTNYYDMDNYQQVEHKSWLNNLTSNLNSSIKRRFSETFYKSLEIQKRPRLVKKCGELNISMEQVPKHKRRLLSDIFNTILDIKWRWHIVIFLLSFLISWFLFATIW
jgi:hypothetical protein